LWQATLDASVTQLLQYTARGLDLDSPNVMPTRWGRRWWKTAFGFKAQDRPEAMQELLSEFQQKVFQVQEEYECEGCTDTRVPQGQLITPFVDAFLKNKEKADLILRMLHNTAPKVLKAAKNLYSMGATMVRDMQRAEGWGATLTKTLEEECKFEQDDGVAWLEDFPNPLFGAVLSLSLEFLTKFSMFLEICIFSRSREEFR